MHPHDYKALALFQTRDANYWASRLFSTETVLANQQFRMLGTALGQDGARNGFRRPLSRAETNLYTPHTLPQGATFTRVVWEVRGEAKDRRVFAQHALWQWVFTQTYIDGGILGSARAHPFEIEDAKYADVVRMGWDDDSLSVFVFDAQTKIPQTLHFDVQLLFGADAPPLEHVVTSRVTLIGTHDSVLEIG